MRSLKDRALELQERDGFMKFYLFRIPIWKGAELEKTNTNEDQIFLIENSMADRFIQYRDDQVEEVSILGRNVRWHCTGSASPGRDAWV